MEASFDTRETRTRKISKKLTQQIHYLLNSSFIVRQHEIATPGQIDECRERGIWFVVSDKYAIYLLIETDTTLMQNEENGKL